jgi:hypothetical protein
VIRILLGNFTPMVRGLIVDALASRSDLSFIDAATEAEPADVDVVLMPAPEGGGDAEVAALLRRRPHSRIVVIAASGRMATVYELCPQIAVVSDLSPASLAQAVYR